MIGKENTGGFRIPKIQEYPRLQGELVNEPHFKKERPKFDPDKLKEAADNFVNALGYAKEDRPAELKKVRSDDPMLQARKMVQAVYYPGLPLEEIYVVWFCAALQNWKALVSTNVKDNRYFEVTADGSKNRAYVDQYFKTGNHAVTLDDF